MVRRVVDVACSTSAERVVVVVGAHGDLVARSLEGSCASYVRNHHHESGSYSSLRVGLDALVEPAVVVVSDMPGISPDVVDAVGASLEAGSWGVITEYVDGPGHPFGLSIGLIEALPAAAPDKFLFGMLIADDRVERVRTRARKPLDVNTPEAYRRLDTSEGD